MIFTRQDFISWVDLVINTLLEWFSSPGFYGQLAIMFLAGVIAFAIAHFLKQRSIFQVAQTEETSQGFRGLLFALEPLVFPFVQILVLALSVDISQELVGESQLLRISESAAVIFLLYSIISNFVKNKLIKNLIIWVVIPASILHVFDALEDVTHYLDTIALQIGNIKVSAYGILRMIVFGTLLFWLGRLSRSAGNRIIRRQEEIDIGTRELFAKLFEVALAIIIFVLLLQLMGINLTALAVFGGALGVGLGFGLQSIATNFISGIILLLDRSLTVGDFIELEDGKKGTIREMNMRSTTVETYDGKDIMVPNERFMNSTFINWTHKNPRQRYSIEISVAYSTDLDQLFPLLKEVLKSHPKVIHGPEFDLDEQPDAEIKGFGDSGIDILIEFWMEGIDDGENRVGGDLLLMIWRALKEHNIQIPFPQREVTIIGHRPLE